MGCYIGIDGGGSKTRFLRVDEQGRAAASIVYGGSYYHQQGAERVAELLRRGVEELTDGEAPLTVGFGMPGLGELPESDAPVLELLRQTFAPTPFFAENDVAMAFHGAFPEGPGILIVGGTGAMSWGRGLDGATARCGGWSDFFGDEGSGNWIGRRALELFSKESDGRAPRTEFYGRAREYFGLAEGESDMNILKAPCCWPGDRKGTAGLHLLLMGAAESGDPAALRIYDEAAEELCALAAALRERLGFRGRTPVACVGGLFNCRELIAEPVRKKLEAAFPAELREPELDPCQGAALLAAERAFGEGVARALRAGMLRAKAEERS